MTREEINTLADAGYTIPRLADRYDKSHQYMRKLCSQWPDVFEKIVRNGKKKNKLDFGRPRQCR